MAYQYRCGPENWTNMEMTDQYRWGPKNSNWHGKWPINIGVVPKTELTRWMTDQYRCGLENWTDKKNDWSI